MARTRQYTQVATEEVDSLYQSGKSMSAIAKLMNTNVWQVKLALSITKRKSGFQPGHTLNMGQTYSKDRVKKVADAQRGIPRKPLSLEHKVKISQANLNRKHDYMWNNRISLGRKGIKFTTAQKKKMRISRIKRIEQCKNDGLPILPAIGRAETQILDMLELCLCIPIVRQYKVEGYYLDGYCPNINLAIEVDERYHKMRKNKDMIRQTEIQRALGCTFLRIEVQ